MFKNSKNNNKPYIINKINMKNFVFKPLLFEDKNDLKLNEIINTKKPIVYDDLYNQLKELIKSQNPTVKLSETDYEQKITAFLNGKNIAEYGVWVYYEWSNRLVRVLPEEEFILVRTNRNQYKITPEERAILATKIIGVVGLSVGQSIALTLAMERGFGELRLADFDLLELSNLNRIRSGVHNLGVPKVVIAAREIAEIDPYLKVTCFDDGLTTENMEDFFMKGGKLDLLVDECDSLDIKIQSRYKAKELKIPVIMDTSDRGMMDIERFDLEPNRPLLHGLVGDLNPEKIKGLTNEQKIPYILPMVGNTAISSRLKASMMEVEQTITTWPQLASSVALGGALGADISRRILLDQLHVSGRFYIDLDELIADEKKSNFFDDLYNPSNEPKEKGIEFFASLQHPQFELTTNLVVPSKNEVHQIIEAACLAPSGGNMQPWRFVWANNSIYLYHDLACSYSFLDYNNLGSHIGFGAAIENLKIKASEFLLYPVVKYFPNPNNHELIAMIQFEKRNIVKDSLSDGLGLRVTNRKVDKKTNLSVDKLELISNEMASFSEFSLKWIENANDLEQVAEIVTTSDMIRILHPQGHYDLFNKEMRWNEKETIETADGIDIETMEVSLSDRAALAMSGDENAIAYLRNWNKGTGFKKMSRKAVLNSSAVGLIISKELNAETFLNGGAALQRIWIKANQLGIAFQPISATTFMFQRLLNETHSSFNINSKELLYKMYEQNKKLWKLNDNDTAIFMFKLHHADEPTARSLRKAKEKLFYYNE